MSDVNPKVALEINRESGAVTITANDRRIVIQADGKFTIHSDVVPAATYPDDVHEARRQLEMARELQRAYDKQKEDIRQAFEKKTREYPLGRRWPGAGSVSGRDLPPPDVYWREPPTILPYLPKPHQGAPQFGLDSPPTQYLPDQQAANKVIRGEVADWPMANCGPARPLSAAAADLPSPNCGPSPDMLDVVEKPAVPKWDCERPECLACQPRRVAHD